MRGSAVCCFLSLFEPQFYKNNPSVLCSGPRPSCKVWLDAPFLWPAVWYGCPADRLLITCDVSDHIFRPSKLTAALPHWFPELRPISALTQQTFRTFNLVLFLLNIWSLRPGRSDLVLIKAESSRYSLLSLPRLDGTFLLCPCSHFQLLIFTFIKTLHFSFCRWPPECCSEN